MKKAPCFLLATALLVTSLVACGNKEDLTATTMTLLGYEGTVELEEDGKTVTLMDNLRLHNGNALLTEKKSTVDISLDDSKTVGLDEKSRAEFNQEQKKLRIYLSEGRLYFYTTEKLAANEQFDIETDNIIVGIRGTSGVVEVDEENPDNTTITCTSGSVDVTAGSESDGTTKKAKVNAGESALIEKHDNLTGNDAISITKSQATEESIPQFFWVAVTKQPKVMGDIVEQSHFSEDVAKEIAATGSATNARAKQAEAAQQDNAQAEGSQGAGQGVGEGADDQQTANAQTGNANATGRTQQNRQTQNNTLT